MREVVETFMNKVTRQDGALAWRVRGAGTRRLARSAEGARGPPLLGARRKRAKGAIIGERGAERALAEVSCVRAMEKAWREIVLKQCLMIAGSTEWRS